jgi:hypothetical protein
VGTFGPSHLVISKVGVLVTVDSVSESDIEELLSTVLSCFSLYDPRPYISYAHVLLSINSISGVVALLAEVDVVGWRWQQFDSEAHQESRDQYSRHCHSLQPITSYRVVPKQLRCCSAGT